MTNKHFLEGQVVVPQGNCCCGAVSDYPGSKLMGRVRIIAAA